MKKFLLFLLIPNIFLNAEALTVDLICDGEVILFCDDGTECAKESAIEKIKISGGTLIHKLHGNHFLDIDDNSVKFKELMDDGSVGFSLFIDRKNGQINIVSRWQKHFEYEGHCIVEPLPERLRIE